MEINLNTYQLDSDLSSGYSAIQRLNNRGLVQRKEGWRRSFRPSLPSPPVFVAPFFVLCSNTVKWQNLPSWILHLLVCCFAFLAKLRCWGGDLREGAENYYYFQQKGWKRRRGKVQFIPQEWVLWKTDYWNFFQSSISLADSAKLLVRVRILVLFPFFVRAVFTIGNSSFSRSSKTSTLLPTLVAPSVANYC